LSFNGDKGILDAFLKAPEIIIGLLSITLVCAIIWVLLIRFFSKSVVIVTKVVKVTILTTMGVQQESTRGFILFIGGAVGVVAYDYWTRKHILFAADMIKYLIIAIKANPSILMGSS